MSVPVRRILPPVWLLLGLISAVLLDRALPLLVYLREPWIFTGFIPLTLGCVMAATSAAAFRRAGTPVVPFEPSKKLVLSGWYRFTRNPMYFGLLLVQLGVGMLLGSVGALVPLPVLMAVLHFRFILDEEHFLDGIFGEEYRSYRASVRRWI
jgi:protein-S-isoprenylcysteine O-methyltransferase Ste14